MPTETGRKNGFISRSGTRQLLKKFTRSSVEGRFQWQVTVISNKSKQLEQMVASLPYQHRCFIELDDKSCGNVGRKWWKKHSPWFMKSYTSQKQLSMCFLFTSTYQAAAEAFVISRK